FAMYNGTGQTVLFAAPSYRFNSPSFLSTYVPTTTAAVGPTDTGTTAPIPATTALGYLAEAAATNVQPNGNDLNAAGWVK
ncbi:hypothetical protein ACI3PL_30280, partial [Lacticaseibacillus paracasei]